MKKVAKWLLAEAQEERNRIQRAEPQVRVDHRTGELDLDSEDGRLRLQTTKARSLVLREAMLCVRLFFDEAPVDAGELSVFLQDAHDELVIETLEAIRKWKCAGVLPELLELYRMYPSERSWDSGHVLAEASGDSKAEARWRAHFGHPDKRRNRPEVVRALRACLETLTGETHEAPDALAAWMGDGDRARSAA